MGIGAGGIFRLDGTTPIHRMGFGTIRLVGPEAWGEPADPANSAAVLRRAVELGIDFIDTAEGYGPLIGERIVGDALSPYPPGFVIASKCGLDRTREGNGPINYGRKGSPAAIRASCDAALLRLRTDHIGLYQLHRTDPAVPIEESVGALDQLRAEGKIGHIGLCDVSIEQVERARAVAPIASVANHYTVIHRKDEALLDYCTANGIALIPFQPLHTGKLLGPDSPLAPIATRLGVQPAQIAIAWLLARAPNIIAIPGTHSIAHLEANIAACDIVLSAADMAELDKLGKTAA